MKEVSAEEKSELGGSPGGSGKRFCGAAGVQVAAAEAAAEVPSRARSPHALRRAQSIPASRRTQPGQQGAMSDSSNSTGSTGSSNNSWTLLSPEEAAIENVGPVDDGTESLGDAPSLSEEVAGAAADFKPADVSVETVLSEEGHQVCQETSPPDNEHLGGVSFVTNIDLSAPLDVPEVDLSEQLSLTPPTAEGPAPPELDTPADSGEAGAEPDPPTETLSAADSPPCVEAGSGEPPEPTEPPRSDPEPPLTERSDDGGPEPETVGSAADEEETLKAEEALTQEEEEEDEESSGSFHDGLRRRNVASFDAARPRTSDEDEEEEEEVELKLPGREEDKPWLSVNKCIVGALVLLFLGSLFLSGDFDASELSDGERGQDWIRPDPQDMKALMEELQQENQEIRQLEDQLQSKTEALDSEMRAAAASGNERGKADLEAENVKLKAELSSLPELKKELEHLRARVTELSRLSADAAPPAAPPSSSQPDDAVESRGPSRTPAPEER
ncbi:hypothetical protein OJAV_G00115280 [Oryzias javanicus]|uniref:Uncharacterized protein n=1 Tax=Oryzias javanicus TaxID=123683 RepID=A0A3S2Q1H2_ORYJA|nr:hypothetical protein OJAV_G00115280 [Oryzias javanicus]